LEVINPAITIKTIGHQWYWTAECEGIEKPIDIYMKDTGELPEGQLRLLEVDNRIVVPVDTHIRIIVSSTDVIHSLGLPSLGLKMDAIPGRLNQTSFIAKREGVFYGQCSELCGVWHGFMPIVIEAVSLEKYLTWINSQID